MTVPDMLDKMKASQHSKRQSMKVCLNNKYSGAVYIPDWSLLIQSMGCNMFPKADHHAFAKSVYDHSPSVMHSVISQDLSQQLCDHIETKKSGGPKRIPKNWITVHKINNVPSPENKKHK